jgi:Flp pilus assembly pilin Flp
MIRWVAFAGRFRERCRRAYRGVRTFLARHDRGASLVEYALLIGLLALATIVALQLMSNSFSNAFNFIGGTFNNSTKPN